MLPRRRVQVQQAVQADLADYAVIDGLEVNADIVVNNAGIGGAMVPLLTLGLPTSATAAVMLAGFQQYNIQPGPLLFVQHADLVWALIASLFIANVMLLVLNLPLVGLWVRLLKIPLPWLYAGILVFACMGTIAEIGRAHV